MSQKPTIPTQYLPQPCGTSPRLTIFTNHNQFMYLILTFTQPRRQPRYKTVRGVRVQCGRRWHFEDPICLAQINPPTNKFHIFALPSAPLETCVWYALVETCNALRTTSSSMPIKYCYTPCDDIEAFIAVKRCPVNEVGSDFSLAYADVEAGNSNLQINSVTLKAPTSGSYSCTADAVFDQNPFAGLSYSGYMYFRGSSGIEFGEGAEFQCIPGQQVTASASGSANLGVDELVTVHVRRTSPSGLIERDVALNADSRWSLTKL